MSVVLGFLGGLAAVGLKALLDVAHERRRTRSAVRAACRLVHAELGDWHIWLRFVYSDNCWWPAPANASTTAWEQHRALLADQLDDETWLRVLDSYSLIRDMHAHRDGALRENRDWLEDVDLRCLRHALDVFESASALVGQRGAMSRTRFDHLTKHRQEALGDGHPPFAVIEAA